MFAKCIAPALVFFLFGAAGEGRADSADEAKAARAQAALQPLKQGLQQALREALQEGAVEAIEVCRLEAPRIAETAAAEHGLRLGRTSDRLRNPANAPRPWQKPLLKEFAQTPPAPGSHRLVPLEKGGYGYAEPIFVQPMCVTCHGENLAEPVQAVLNEKYPHDRATGYEASDFRGLFWVELPAEKP